MKTQRLIELILLTTMYLIIISIVSYFWFLRLLPKLSRNIFSPVCFEQGLVYFSLLCINIIVIVFLITSYKNKQTPKEKILLLMVKDFISLIENGTRSIIELILKIPYGDYPMAYLVYYCLNISPSIYKFICYASQISFLIVFSIDVFHYERFYLSYKCAILLLINIICRIIVFISITYHNVILQEISKSLTIINGEKTLDSSYVLNDTNYELSQYNTQFDTVKDALTLRSIIFYENIILYTIQSAFIIPLWFSLCKRITYLLIWTYIFIYYNCFVLFPLLSLLANYINKNTSISIIIIFSFVLFLYRYNNNVK